MDKILSIQTIKNVFAALGAKTSDDNYGVALLDKTTAEPKGLMGMSDLASVLGASFSQLTTSISSSLKSAPTGVWYIHNPSTFSDNPYPNNGDHASILIKSGIISTGMIGSVLIDVESASQPLFGIYVTYGNAPWVKLV